MTFTIEGRDTGSAARGGILHTGHGAIATPVFMPVGTAGTVKAVHQAELVNDTQASVILANTYHLNLRPGMAVLEKAGGLHRFMNWQRPVLTDSGGYQVFSLSEQRRISEDGVAFRSHIDGSAHFIAPEDAIRMQRIIGADIVMAFDECTPYPCPLNDARASMQRTHRWLDRCLEAFAAGGPMYGHPQALFPIVQGSTYRELRVESADRIAATGSPGHAIGGLSVGEPTSLLYEMTACVCERLPADRPRYLMGVGTPANLLECIALGVDMFDCVLPTRNGRNGMLFTGDGIINIRNEKWKDDFSPLDENGHSFVDTLYSKAYLRHLFASREILGLQIATLHNLAFYTGLMREARRRILDGTFTAWKNDLVPRLERRL